MVRVPLMLLLRVSAPVQCRRGGRLGHCCTQLWGASGKPKRFASGASQKPISEEALKKLCPDFRNQDPRDMLHKGVNTQDKPEERLPIMHIKVTHNNTMFTITDQDGKVLAWTSAGAEGFRNARRGTTFAAQTAAVAAAKKALGLGLQKFRVKIKGLGQGRQPSLKGLESGGLSVVSIQDVTPVPHNGCKPQKARRL